MSLLLRAGAALLLVVASFGAFPAFLPEALAILAYAIAGYDVLYRAVRNILRGRVFDEHFLMALATVGAMVISEYKEAAAVMIFYQVGSSSRTTRWTAPGAPLPRPWTCGLKAPGF